MASPAALQPEVLRSVLALAREHHVDGLDVQDLADHAHYSRHHFSRMFAAAQGMPPGQYLTALRIHSAKQLLLADGDPVIDVAMAVGFDSLSSFTRRFTTTVGVPPARLRRLAAQLDEAAPRPFSLGDPNQPHVRVRPVLPGEVDQDCLLWLGWYPAPAPVGLPRAGALTPHDEAITLPLSPGAPWLLGFVVEPGDEPRHQLLPSSPVVAVHPVPVVTAAVVDLQFRRATVDDMPLLSALPSLAHPG